MRTSLTFVLYMAVSSLSVSLLLLYPETYIFVNRREFWVVINFVFAADFARFSVGGGCVFRNICYNVSESFLFLMGKGR